MRPGEISLLPFLVKKTLLKEEIQERINGEGGERSDLWMHCERVVEREKQKEGVLIGVWVYSL